MSSLLHHLRSSGAVGPDELDAATRRQQIYGGSLDTVLLELDLIQPAVLADALAQATRLPNAPASWLEPRDLRPWAAIPNSVADLGWAVPLGREGETTLVAVHPEIPDEHMDQLRARGDELRLMVTAECALARVASERTGSLTPQRYAILAARWVQALGGRAEAGPRPAGGAPWRQSDPSAATAATLTPRMRTGEPAKRPRSATGPRMTPPASATGAPPSWERAPGPSSPPAADPEPSASTSGATLSVPKSGAGSIPTFAPPGASGSFSNVASWGRQDAGSPTTAPPPAADEIDLAPFIEALDAAADRDGLTDALFAAFEALFERVALFAIRKDLLRPLSISARLEHASEEDIALTASLEDFLRRSKDEPSLRPQDAAIRRALGLPATTPCEAVSVRVAGRDVLLAYGDLGGHEIDAARVQRASKLCERAGAALLRILQARKSKQTAAPKASEAPTLVAPPPAPVSARPPAPAAQPPTPPADPPTNVIPQLPRLIDRPPKRENTLISTTKPSAASEAPGPVSPPADSSAATPSPVPRLLTPRPASAPSAEPPPVRERTGAATPSFNPPPVRKTLVPTVKATPGAPPVRRGTPEAPVAMPSASASVQDATLKPRMGAVVPPVRTTPKGVSTSKPVRPSRSPTIEAPAVSPRLAPASSGGIVSLGPPLAQPPARGTLQLDDEDRHDDSQERLPSSGGANQRELDDAIDRAIRDPQAVPHLLELGEAALARVAARFPGPIDLMKRDLNALPPLPAHGPLIRLTLGLGSRMVPRIRELLDHPDAQVRFYAAFTFQELRDDTVLDALATRAFDPDGDVRTISMRVLETYSRAPEFSKRVGRVRGELRSDNQTRQIHAARAVGTLRDVSAVPDLINLLDDPESRVRDIGLEALCSITGQQLGARAGRWRNWWAANADRSRVEWIIDALSHKEAAVRRWASGELRRITGQPYALPADGSKAEREAVIRLWKEWWESAGREAMS